MSAQIAFIGVYLIVQIAVAFLILASRMVHAKIFLADAVSVGRRAPAAA